MNDLESLENKKKELQTQQVEIDRLIKAAKDKREQEREINLRGLFNRMDSLINTSKSSFSEESIGEIYELGYDLNCAESYMRTIDVEISGRMIESGEAYHIPLSNLRNASMADDPTVVVSFLIPFDMVAGDPFFNKDS